MKINEIYEASAAVDTAVGTVRDIASPASAGAMVAQYVPKLPAAIKTFGKKAFPVANAAYQASDAAKRALAGDEVGATIAGASAIPVLSIPGAVVQAGRDKIRTGSFSPSDDEIKTAAKKDKEAGGYWKARGSEYDPSYMPESTVMKSNRLQVAIIKEELTLKKCSMTEEQIRNTLFIYKDRQGNLFTESGKHIDQSRLDEAPNPFPLIGQGLKTGWNAVKAGGEWAAKNVPPAYRATKAGLGATADELGNIYQGVKKPVAAFGNELVDIPTNAVRKLKSAYQDIRYGTTPNMDPAQRLAHIDDYKTTTNLQDLGQTEVNKINQKIKDDARIAKATADGITTTARGTAAKDLATAADIEAKRPVDWKKVGRNTAITGTVAAGVTDVAKGTDVRQDDAGNVIGGGYVPTRGIQRVMGIDEDQTTSLWDYLFGKKKPQEKPPAPPAAEPAKPPAAEPAKPEPAAEPAKPPATDKPPAKTDVNPGYLDTSGFENPDKPAKPANTGSDKVIAMQKKLKAAGYDIGTFGAAGDGIDGKWGSKTQAAYDAYKADKNLKRAGQPDAASRERERIAAQSNATQAPKDGDAATYWNNNKIDVKDLQTNYPRAAAVTEPVTRSTPWGGIQTPTDALQKIIQTGQGRGQELASKPALNTNSVPYAIDAKATADRDRVAALMKEELQDMLRLSGLQGK